MLKHCVFVNFRPEFNQNARNEMLAEFNILSKDVIGMLDYSFGKNLDFENKSSQYSDGFVITFTDRTALQAYANHPQHITLGNKMIEMCADGVNGIIVFDLDV
jgi:hypothetical protein